MEEDMHLVYTQDKVYSGLLVGYSPLATVIKDIITGELSIIRNEDIEYSGPAYKYF